MLKFSITRTSRFGTCCNERDKSLMRIVNLSESLYRLLTSSEPEEIQFRKNICRYNAAFAFISLDVEMNGRLIRNGFRPFQIHEEIYQDYYLHLASI